MISMFDLEKLKELLRDFYAVSHIRIAVFDEGQHELVSYPPEYAPYCKRIRSCVAGQAACVASDKRACEIAAKTRKTQVYRCHAGLTEAITPLYVGEILVGFLLFGHVFSYTDQEEGANTIAQLCDKYPIDPVALKQDLHAATPFSKAYIRSAAHLMHAVASYLLLERMATLKENALAARLDSYLSAHFAEKMDAQSICATLGIGKTRLYQLSNQLYGKGVAEHIRSLRLAFAKKLLLENKELSLAEIAEKSGFPDYNYFIAVFSKAEGVSPARWRKAH